MSEEIFISLNTELPEDWDTEPPVYFKVTKVKDVEDRPFPDITEQAFVVGGLFEFADYLESDG